MKTIVLLAGVIAAGSAVFGAQAAETKAGARAVLELFTSQGCSSCPPADALLKSLADSPDVIALAYHVDYWDYIGWADTFGAKANTERQRDYAAAWNSNRIYTPQLVVNGLKDVVGSRQADVQSAIGAANLALPIALTSDNHDMLQVDIGSNDRLQEASVWLITYVRDAVVKVDRGENSGKTIDYSHVVTGRQVLGMWEPGSGAHLKLPLDQVLSKGNDGAVILVQEDRHGLPGRILGAASYQR